MKKTQLLKGVLEGCVLLIIKEKEVYGYELVQQLEKSGFEDIVGGTVYPILQKLEKNQLTTSVKKPSSDGPDRKYYQITEKGRDYCDDFVQSWKELESSVHHLID
ncbi:PadR family transcriptional regulator [Marinilactibacillus sp. Marseille-P9653]|uniref:PadR family transcriptional regulator n=1 Tax=Marinilactibacillus sp. Marseille-P9653 TaxID=2866583 RepID=UPI001CE49610|nr:PadR family transcriptional regulator [Marinilactibacillus sp. Marseille-P9653]